MNDLSATDRCVKCGLCLPHCPTFTLTGNEADSPRGRISLMQWLSDTPDISPGLLTHIDRCLQCGACEAMCPSNVPFGALMDTARAQLAPQHSPGFSNRVLTGIGTRLLTSPRALRLAGPALEGYRRLKLPALLGKLPGTTGRLNRLLDSKAGPINPIRRTHVQQTSTPTRVHLFPGCTGHTLDRQTLYDAQNLLLALDFDAAISEKTACCGALHQHHGDPQTAASLATQNYAALDDTAPVISIASGCAAHLQYYDALEFDKPSPPFSPRVSEIMAFLAKQDPASLHFNPCEYPVGVYVPCTQRNALRQSQALLDALNWIPGLEICHINPQGGCCGAAGSYMITQPAFSDRLGDGVADGIIDSGVRTLVTTNIGCSIQLQARLHKQGGNIEVIHPVTLLWRLLRQ